MIETCHLAFSAQFVYSHSNASILGMHAHAHMHTRLLCHRHERVKQKKEAGHHRGRRRDAQGAPARLMELGAIGAPGLRVEGPATTRDATWCPNSAPWRQMVPVAPMFVQNPSSGSPISAQILGDPLRTLGPCVLPPLLAAPSRVGRHRYPGDARSPAQASGNSGHERTPERRRASEGRTHRGAPECLAHARQNAPAGGDARLSFCMPRVPGDCRHDVRCSRLGALLLRALRMPPSSAGAEHAALAGDMPRRAAANRAWIAAFLAFA